MPYPDRFYPVVDSVAWLKRLAGLGVGTVQLRAKNLSHADALALVREALAATRGTATKLVVNDYWQAAIEAKAQHLHLGQEDLADLADADVKAIRAAGLTLGLSTHDDAELENALKYDPDYVALGPIYPDHAQGHALCAAGHPAHHRMEEARRKNPAGRHRRHQARTGSRNLRCRRGFHRRRQRRHAKPRSRCARARLACARKPEAAATIRS